MKFDRGIYLSKQQLSDSQVKALREAFFYALKICDHAKRAASAADNMSNTVHHCLFMSEIFEEVVTSDANWAIVREFFGGGKFILNSLGGNNNCEGNVNYASEIHRDVRFFTRDRLVLNSILCVSPICERTGATELFLPKDGECHDTLRLEDSDTYVLDAEPGDVFYFDSRIWHRAGAAQQNVAERIIFTPIYSRPFMKPGFDYSGALQIRTPERHSPRMKQLCGYYSDVPATLEQWYGGDGRRFYMKEQDIW